MTTEITFEAVVAAAERVLAKYGRDWVYSAPGGDCFYSPEGMELAARKDEPAPTEHAFPTGSISGCFVGEIFRDAFPEVYESLRFEELTISSFLEQNFPQSTEWKGRAYLALLQGEQDAGEPWGSAHDYAIRRISEDYPDV